MAIAHVDPIGTGSALQCGSQLRVAATMLSDSLPGDISAVTVVGVLGRDDLRAFNTLVSQIEDDLDLDADVVHHVGSFSVHFSRRARCD